MGQSPEELRREIESTRAGLGETLDAIGDRVSPGRIMERRKNRVTGGLRSARDRVMGPTMDLEHRLADHAHGAAGSARDMPDALKSQTGGNPLLAGALSFGAGFLVAMALPASRAEQQATEQIMSKTQPLIDDLERSGHEMLDNLKEPARQAVDEVRSAAGESAQSLAGSAREAAQQTTDEARDAVESVRQESGRS